MRLQASIVFAAALSLGLLAAQGAAQAGSLSDPASLNEQAPAVYKAKFDTSKGSFVVEVHRDWAPNGADRFYNLVKNGYYNDARFFRVINGFMVQFGINGDPKISAVWRDASIKDDPVKQSNTPPPVPIRARRRRSSISATMPASTGRASRPSAR